jgi:Transposase
MGRAISRYKLKEKEDIVNEAYSQLNNIKSTAKEYGVQPTNIRYWSKQFSVGKAAASYGRRQMGVASMGIHHDGHHSKQLASSYDHGGKVAEAVESEVAPANERGFEVIDSDDDDPDIYVDDDNTLEAARLFPAV